MDASFTLFAQQLADLAGERIRRYFRKTYTSETKADASFVTQADREAEEVMRDAIMKRFPDHGIWGEEYGKHQEQAEYCWVLDPVDGTRSFMAGFPTFGTLIALVHRAVPLFGVIDQPINKERWIGGRELPSTLNGRIISTKSSVLLKDALISTTSPDLFAPSELQAFSRVRQAGRDTVYGYDCYAYAMLASGHIDIVIETGLKPHDFCALAPVIENAGGVMTDWNGQPITFHSDGRVVAAANPKLHADVMRVLSL